MATMGNVEKWRRRGQFSMSIGIRDSSTSANPTVLGFINKGGTLAPSSSPGTQVGGTECLLDLTRTRLRVPAQGTSVGTATVRFGTAAGLGGSVGDILLGFTAASAQLGIVIAGTVFSIQWPIAGGTPLVVANPAGA